MTTTKTAEKGKISVSMTERLEIRPNNVSYLLEPVGGTFKFLVMLKNWEDLRDRIKPEYDLNFQFTRSGEAVRNLHLGKAREAFRRSGVSGTLEGGFDPRSLSLRIIVSRPPGHQIIVSCDKGGPDAVDIEIPDEPADQEAKVSPVLLSRMRSSGMINLVEDEDVAGNWNLRLRGEAVPALQVSPEFGKERIVNDPEMQNAILPSVFRRIVTELALRPSEYENEAWSANWRELAASVAPGGRWEFYTGEEGEEYEVSEVEGKVEEGLEEYQKKHLPPLPKRRTARYEASED